MFLEDLATERTLQAEFYDELDNCSQNQQLLEGFFYASELPFRRVLLS